MNKKLLSLYSLKFNPFSPEIPTAALWVSPSLESFCWRIEQQIGEGGFALALGDPGTGKSAALRILDALARYLERVKAMSNVSKTSNLRSSGCESATTAFASIIAKTLFASAP